MESGLSRDTGPSSAPDPELALYAALIRFNGEPSLVDMLGAFEMVIASGPGLRGDGEGCYRCVDG